MRSYPRPISLDYARHVAYASCCSYSGAAALLRGDVPAICGVVNERTWVDRDRYLARRWAI